MKDLTVQARCCEGADCCMPVLASEVIRAREQAGVPLISSHRVRAVLPVAAMLAAVSLWGPSFVATKMALQEIPPFTIAFLRFFVASCLLYPLWWISNQRTVLNKEERRHLFLGGLVGVTFYFVLANLGLNFTAAGDAALLMAAIPVICLLAETVWFRQSMPWRRGLGIIVSIIGVFMVIRQAPSLGGKAQVLGDLLVLAATLCWAAYTLIGRTPNRVPKLTLVAHQAMYGMLMLFPFALFEMGQWQKPSLIPCLSILYLGLMCSAITYLLYNYALKALAASQVSAFLNLVPVIGVLAAVFLLGEQIQVIQIIGGAAILVGVAVSTRS
jgi:drug/metabolite transporter (DMT)-like permease